MALDRWIGLMVLLGFGLYGYTAFFTMDDLLPPILRINPIWPSSFPKVLAVGGAVVALGVVSGIERAPTRSATEIDYTRLGQYYVGRALFLVALMLAYAVFLRPIGFLASTVLFLFVGSVVLGERRLLLAAVVSGSAAVTVWYLVHTVLGIYLRPLPAFVW